MKIRTEYVAMGVYRAWDDEADAETREQGAGKTAEDAINDLVAQLIDAAEDQAYAEGRKDEAEEAAKPPIRAGGRGI